MRLTRFLGAVALVLLAAGCKHAGERLEGHWHGVRAEGVASDQQVAANAFAVGTDLEFKSGTLHVKTPKDEQTGKYKVTTEDKQSVTVTTDRDGAADPQTFYFPDEHTMRWQVLEGKAITFQKE